MYKHPRATAMARPKLEKITPELLEHMEDIKLPLETRTEHVPISVAKRNELVPYLMEPLAIRLFNFHWTGSKLVADVSVKVPDGYAMIHQVDYMFLPR